ncbi:MAG: cysteine hydrolase [Firmicutes bacterium]|nr:cysteine hydrolase [Bacillota bacterium]
MKQALMIIDMLNDFVQENGSLYIGEAGQEIIKPIQSELAEARRNNVPVLYVCDRHRPDDAEFRMFPPHCLVGSWGAAVCPELAPQEKDVIIPKRRYSGFFGTELDLTLRELGVEELILVGVCTNICVLYTAADARMRGYRVKVLKNQVATFDPGAHEFALREMEKTLGVEIIDR